MTAVELKIPVSARELRPGCRDRSSVPEAIGVSAAGILWREASASKQLYEIRAGSDTNEKGITDYGRRVIVFDRRFC